MTQDRYLKTGEVARLLNVSTAAVRNWIAEGRLDGVQVGSHWQVRLSALETFLGMPLADFVIGGADVGGAD